MLHQLSENDDDDHNTRLLKKALQYRKRPPHVNVTVSDDTEVASCRREGRRAVYVVYL
ncbi:hypothetical protein SPRG_11028 [Saprolegnia parasitica CBS 223.65]|uniref:Uncharacterized protein n=1 Tax=Saprolegnia parasitica (strain CBS 223.65) TaxID=695850 RepID=A0A067BW49_SAPPC|nr:hypothetical protein SPRG_11028 [Saprolegnia parasitica CBS 223.65]KDO22714.1 hypothetical protein SPRG_11028 [Saprolegnia parasitica CBS 223.65]|eukprot:XP_012206624.1 hypothetical protein SPRG_11028 [Saprolegnia parasitica CBS 223.65]